MTNKANRASAQTQNTVAECWDDYLARIKEGLPRGMPLSEAYPNEVLENMKRIFYAGASYMLQMEHRLSPVNNPIMRPPLWNKFCTGWSQELQDVLVAVPADETQE
jgi:hypothetical protein